MKKRSSRIVLTVLLLSVLFYAVGKPNSLSNPSENNGPALVGYFTATLGNLNVLECTNPFSETIKLKLLVKKNNGKELASDELTIAGNGTINTVLNNYDGVEESYGTYVLRYKGGRPRTQLPICFTAVYRLSATNSDKPFEYGYALEPLNPLPSTSYGVINTFDASGRGVPTPTWLSLYSVGPDQLKAIVTLYQDRSKKPYATFTVDLPPSSRRDYPISFDGEKVGLYSIAIKSGAAGAFVTRFAKQSRTSDTYQFAYVSTPLSGTCNSRPLPASTMSSELNWATIANISTKTKTVIVQVKNQHNVLVYQTPIKLKGRQQFHLNLNKHLGTNTLGSVNLLCTKSSDKILLESTIYGRSITTPSLEYAYVSQHQLREKSDKTISLINTFEKSANWLRPQADETTSGIATSQIFGSDGKKLASVKSQITKGASKSIPLHEIAGTNVVGSLRLSSALDTLQPTVLRVFEKKSSSAPGLVMPIPSFPIASKGSPIPDEPELPHEAPPLIPPPSGSNSSTSDENTLPVIPIVCTHKTVTVSQGEAETIDGTPTCTHLNGAPLRFSRYIDPLHGTLEGDLDTENIGGGIRYLPELPFAGEDSYTIKVSDDSSTNPVLASVSIEIISEETISSEKSETAVEPALTTSIQTTLSTSLSTISSTTIAPQTITSTTSLSSTTSSLIPVTSLSSTSSSLSTSQTTTVPISVPTTSLPFSSSVTSSSTSLSSVSASSSTTSAVSTSFTTTAPLSVTTSLPPTTSLGLTSTLSTLSTSVTTSVSSSSSTTTSIVSTSIRPRINFEAVIN